MASDKQIAANRANAMRSTGPKTTAGKRKSSRNAYRHGLSGPAASDPAASAKVEAIAQELSGERSSEDRLTSAVDFVRAQLELLRIRSIRSNWLGKVDPNDNNLQKLHRLAALDRYERYALTRRRRAATKI
jgi:hypothetical protein